MLERVLAGDLEGAMRCSADRALRWWLDELLPKAARELANAWSEDRHTLSEVVGAMSLLFVLAKTKRRHLLVDESGWRGTVVLTAPHTDQPLAAASQLLGLELWESALEREGYEVLVGADELETLLPCAGVSVGLFAHDPEMHRRALTALPTDGLFVATLDSQCWTMATDLDLPAFRAPRDGLRWLRRREAATCTSTGTRSRSSAASGARTS